MPDRLWVVRPPAQGRPEKDIPYYVYFGLKPEPDASPSKWPWTSQMKGFDPHDWKRLSPIHLEPCEGPVEVTQMMEVQR